MGLELKNVNNRAIAFRLYAQMNYNNNDNMQLAAKRAPLTHWCLYIQTLELGLLGNRYLTCKRG